MRTKLVWMVAVLVHTGCSVRGPYYAATIVEPPTQGESPLADDNWVVLVDLDDREVLGTSRVSVGFNGDELTCEEGGGDPRPWFLKSNVAKPPSPQSSVLCGAVSTTGLTLRSKSTPSPGFVETAGQPPIRPEFLPGDTRPDS